MVPVRWVRFPPHGTAEETRARRRRAIWSQTGQTDRKLLKPSNCVGNLTQKKKKKRWNCGWSRFSDRCSWGWSCSTGPERWGPSDIRWRSIPPERSRGCIQSGSRPRQRSCSPCAGRFGAPGPSCTGWRWSAEQLQRKRTQKKEGF